MRHLHVHQYRQRKQLVHASAGVDRGMQAPDKGGQCRPHISGEPARHLPHGGHPFAEHIGREHLPDRVVVIDLRQRATNRFYRAVRAPNNGDRCRQPDQLRRGDLQGVGQGHDLRKAVQSAFPALDLGQTRLADPGQPGHHPQRLVPRVADLP